MGSFLRTRITFFIILLLQGSLSFNSYAVPDLYVTDGTVKGIVRLGDTLYIGAVLTM